MGELLVILLVLTFFAGMFVGTGNREPAVETVACSHDMTRDFVAQVDRRLIDMKLCSACQAISITGLHQHAVDDSGRCSMCATKGILDGYL